MMTDARVLEPEWLDELPHEDARARRSRRDLVRVNALMGNARIVAKELARVPGLRAIAEIGSGDGAFLRGVLRRLGDPALEVYLVDRQPVGNVTADVFDWLGDPAGPPVDAIVANLFLHHFDEEGLRRMLELISRRTRAFIACEPRRSSSALLGAKLLGFVGCNDVTCHDAAVSVRAGFVDGEIAALWPDLPGWRCEERARGRFSHGFVARFHG
jgi:hypothetical protein